MSMSRGETWAAAAALVIGVPLVFMFARAASEGETRRVEAPLRAILGNRTFEAFASGETPPQHYLGQNRRAPDFTLRDREGRPWRLRDHRGQVVVMNFWTVTCVPCIEEMPSLEELGRIARHRPEIELVTVCTDANWRTASRAFPGREPGVRVLFDPDKSVVRGKYGTRLYPETWIVDADGVIRLRIDGPRDWSSALAVNLIESFR